MDNRRGQPQRLGKLQKWILATCYRKTVLHDNTGLIVSPQFQNEKHKMYGDILFREEIINGYFSGQSRNAGFVSTTRAFESLESKGLVKMWYGVSWNRFTAISLTEEGRKKTETFISNC